MTTETILHKTDFHCQILGPTSCQLFDGQRLIAEIRDLRLQNVRFRPAGQILIGSEVPLPLYWQQYADHENPERNAGAHARLRVLAATPAKLSIECTSSTLSGSVASRYKLTLAHDPARGYRFRVAATLTVAAGKSWRVTRNPQHGELEFCTLWPQGVFSTKPNSVKSFQACAVVRSRETIKIPHHHLETSDKHNIGLQRSDRFLWLLETENPVVEMVSAREVKTGLCAYMWDAHFAYRFCDTDAEKLLHGPATMSAEFLLYSLERAEAERLLQKVVTPDAAEIEGVPIYLPGLNRFCHTLREFAGDESTIWPWATEAPPSQQVEFALDRHVGYDDQCSLRIVASENDCARWVATTLGPAFGQPPFRDAARHRLTAFVRAERLRGAASIGIRLHRSGRGSVFNLDDYETFWCTENLQNSEDWCELTVTTPPISPAPDRLHLLLQQNGAGTTWFDNVLYREV